MLPSYFDYIFVHLRQKVRLRPELSLKLLSASGPNPARTRTRPEKPGLTYNSESPDTDHQTLTVAGRASEKKFSRGYEGRYRAPQAL